MGVPLGWNASYRWCPEAHALTVDAKLHEKFGLHFAWKKCKVGLVRENNFPGAAGGSVPRIIYMPWLKNINKAPDP